MRNIDKVDFLVLEIFTRNAKLIVGVVYRAPRSDFNNTSNFFWI